MLKFLRKIFDRKLTQFVETDIQGFKDIMEVITRDNIICNIFDYKKIDNKITMTLVYSRNRFKDLKKGLNKRGNELWNIDFMKTENTIMEL